MQKIKIITDTASDITFKEAEKLGIKLLPFNVIVGDKEYKEGLDFSKEDFYKMLDDSENIPTTSQITPFEYYETINEIYKEGYENIIIVPINQIASSTFRSALTAREQFLSENPDSKTKIHVINGLTYSYGYGYPVMHAAKMVNDGKEIEEILEFFENWFSRLEIYFTTFDLKYAKQSGRIGKAAAIAGELLGIKPILCLTAGEPVTAGKVRSIAKAVDAMEEFVKERISDDKSYLLFKGTNDEEFKDYEKRMEKIIGTKSKANAQIGACISINSGPKVLGVGFMGEKRDMKVVY